MTVISAGALLLLLAACAQVPDPAEREPRLSSLYDMSREGRFQEVRPLLRDHLLEYPDDAGAHMLLGRCYLASKNISELRMAEGEFETALMYFNRSGKQSPLPPYTDESFELQLHLELPKASLELAHNLVQLLQRNPNLPLTFDGLIAKIDRSLDNARKLRPNSKDVDLLEQNLTNLRILAENYQQPQRPRRRNTPGRRRPAPNNRPLSPQTVGTPT